MKKIKKENKMKKTSKSKNGKIIVLFMFIIVFLIIFVMIIFEIRRSDKNVKTKPKEMRIEGILISSGSEIYNERYTEAITKIQSSLSDINQNSQRLVHSKKRNEDVIVNYNEKTGARRIYMVDGTEIMQVSSSVKYDIDEIIKSD